ncbi:MAG: glycerophosphodiester phosphodiesterase, partial [Caldilineaceae bacterium]|nr:glycerophosphodiester phosphodiesterase [Caldilineaceae bacterium]
MYRISEYPQLIAHRGYSGPYPENTRVAIEAAMRLGVDMVEVDVRITRDGVPVLLHNVTLDETTNGRGRVDAHRFDELHGYDAGAWKGPEFRGERLLSLRETFLMTRDRMPLNLDIKTPAAIAPVI